MGNKKDIQQVKAVAREYNMTKKEEKDFGDFLENEKAEGNGGSKNDKRDFTYQELRQKAREFLGLS